MPAPADPVLVAGLILLLAASLMTWLVLGASQLLGKTILPYKQRRPVPWGAWAMLLAIFFALGSVSSALIHLSRDQEGGKKEVAEETLKEEVTEEVKEEEAGRTLDLALGSFFQASIVASFVLAVAVYSNATWRDLGLPATFGEVCRDVATGVAICMAAYLPVLLVRILTVVVLGTPEDHPMIQLVKHEPSAGMFVVALVSAVIVAPVSEELGFRLLMQGWLEKWDGGMTNDECRMTNGGGGMSNDNSRELAADECRVSNDEEGTVAIESSKFVRRESTMPRGVLPILGSSAMFALAHFGNSSDPVPLFVLALFLGFVYHRTHRILPSIAAHATFNLISMLLLWRMIVTQAVEK